MIDTAFVMLTMATWLNWWQSEKNSKSVHVNLKTLKNMLFLFYLLFILKFTYF